jgi:aminoacrylate peracid reductase
MPKTPIVPEGSPPPLAPYSPGVRAGDMIYVSGVLSLGQDGNVVGPGDAAAQTRQVLEIIKSVLTAGGATMQDVVFNHIFVSDLAHYQEMNSVYREYFPEQPPARYCIRADLVRPEFLVEIASTAYAPLK